MSSAFRVVSCAVWDDDRLESMSRSRPNAGTLWHYLLSCGFDQSIPGLIEGGVGRIADQMRWSYKGTERVLNELVDSGLIKLDRQRAVILIPERVGDLACYPKQPDGVFHWLKSLWRIRKRSPLKAEAIELCAEAMHRRDRARGSKKPVWLPAFRTALQDHGIPEPESLAKYDDPSLEVDLVNDPLDQKIKDQKEEEPPAPASSSKTEEQLDLEAEISVSPALAVRLWSEIAEPAGFPRNRPRKALQAPPLPWRKDGPRDVEAALTELLEHLAAKCRKFARPSPKGHRAWTLKSVLPKAVEILAGVYDSTSGSTSGSPPSTPSGSRPTLVLAPTPPVTPDETKRFASDPMDCREWRVRRKALGLTGSVKEPGGGQHGQKGMDPRRPRRGGEPPASGAREPDRTPTRDSDGRG